MKVPGNLLPIVILCASVSVVAQQPAQQRPLPWWAPIAKEFRIAPIIKPRVVVPPQGIPIPPVPAGPTRIELGYARAGHLVEEAKEAHAQKDLRRADMLFRDAIRVLREHELEEDLHASDYADFLFETRQYRRMREVTGSALARMVALKGIADEAHALKATFPHPKLIARIAVAEAISGGALKGLSDYVHSNIAKRVTDKSDLDGLYHTRSKLQFFAIANCGIDGQGYPPVYYYRCLEMESNNAYINYLIGWRELGEKKYDIAAKRFAIAVKNGTGSLKRGAQQKYDTASQMAKYMRSKKKP